ncbi:MAG TPA: fused MFS/spermidine synthase [Ramlibacter sp.]|nr:fused MFS/spermidine synthase [Ramlibacter sp.]
MPLFALTIFTSAFLLFLVQPLLAKQILPWFGGSAAVWSTCLVFFQSVLLLGYAYSDWTTRKLAPRPQAILHVVLLAASLLVLPIVADPSWKPRGEQDPTAGILGLLVATIGLPYLLLSTTGPLLQSWFARRQPAQTSVYRLFALSNLASLLALLSYPFLIEPWVSGRAQSYAWSAGYALFAALCMACAFSSLRYAAPGPSAVEGDAGGPRPTLADYGNWVVLSAMASAFLLAITNHLTRDVASVPFLWLLPLTVYLLTFILAFEGRGWYRREYFLVPLLLLVAGMAWSLNEGRHLRHIRESVALFTAGLFAWCMFFHGELANSKPRPRYLTGFYLAISFGGSLGGVLVALVAPRVFTGYHEFPLSLMLAVLICLWLLRRMPLVVPAAIASAAAFSGYQLYQHVQASGAHALHLSRSFYGTLKVQDAGSGDRAVRQLMHGVILHGEQYVSAARRNEPTTYYGETSGIGRLLKSLAGQAARVGVVGLGTGTIAAYGKPGDVYRFYELDPAVVEVARSHFTFLAESKAKVETVLGDARLSMEREAAQQYDVLVLDAFSSDSIPVHLMTREAMAVYLKHLKPGGVVAFHISNRFLNLAPVLKNLAQEASLQVVNVVDGAEDSDLSSTEWVLVTRNQALLGREEIAAAVKDIADVAGVGIWTDDSNNLFRILK